MGAIDLTINPNADFLLTFIGASFKGDAEARRYAARVHIRISPVSTSRLTMIGAWPSRWIASTPESALVAGSEPQLAHSLLNLGAASICFELPTSRTLRGS